ncbi:hypothetical protein ACL07V_13820 [Streptomyces sp. MB22_4]|uniref:hypothetical protein n=1 Tax=Streptomyces sp. MB22_4 TaxID=3383120 RepID=UPI0039A0F60B
MGDRLGVALRFRFQRVAQPLGTGPRRTGDERRHPRPGPAVVAALARTRGVRERVVGQTVGAGLPLTTGKRGGPGTP